MKKIAYILGCLLISFILISCIDNQEAPIYLQINQTDLTVKEGDIFNLEVDTNDPAGFHIEIQDETYLKSTSNGAFEALLTGFTKIILRSVTDPSKNVVIAVEILSVSSTGVIQTHVGNTYQLSLHENYTSFDELDMTITNTQRAQVDDQGLVSFYVPGMVKIILKDKETLETVDELNFEIISMILVYMDALETDYMVYDGVTFILGKQLFQSLDEAYQRVASQGTLVLLNGAYHEDITISKSNVTLIGSPDFTLFGKLTINANRIKIQNLQKRENGIHILSGASQTEILMSSFEAIEGDAIVVELSNGLSMIENTFKNITNRAIHIQNFNDQHIRIHKNIIENADDGIVITGEDYMPTAQIEITRNSIQNVKRALSAELFGDKILAYARFNAITDYSEYAAKSNEASGFDFTLNYWGEETLNSNDFIGIKEAMLLGHYPTAEAIISEASYSNLNMPLYIMITNPIEELFYTDDYQLEWLYLPYELSNAKFTITTDNPEIITVDQEGKMTPHRSGRVTISIRASNFPNMTTSMEIGILTDPGIHLIPATKEQNLLVGETIKLHAYAFPYTIENEEIIFESSNTFVATVNSEGIVLGNNEGVTTIKATLKSDPMIYSEYTLMFFEALDDTNLLDILTMQQVHFSEPYRIAIYGIAPTFWVDEYESVSKYYFDDLEINTSMIIPLEPETRPGYKKPDHPAGIPTYNDENIYWVVIHDTAMNTPTGSAIALANYLYNKAATGEIDRVSSWHYSIDDEDVYQHIPDDEVAYHAGDGSTLPGQGDFTGGGNRNGIGIETSVAEGDDIYRVWQRSAKLVALKLSQYNLPRLNLKYHRDFSGKSCPNVLIGSGLMPYFESFVDIEYRIFNEFNEAEITFESHNLDILDNTGRVISHPEFGMTVSYTISVTIGSETHMRTLYTYVPGTVR